MKQALVLLLLVTSFANAATVTCELPKQALVDLFTYACVDNQQQIIWVVFYSQKQLLVSTGSWGTGKLADKLPVVFRPQAMEFFDEDQELQIWFTRAIEGDWIRMQGTQGLRHHHGDK